MSERKPPRLPHPSATPRPVDHAPEPKRERPVFRASSNIDQPWEVVVTPLRHVATGGRAINDSRERPRASFEVRAEFVGLGLPEFSRGAEREEGVRRVEHWLTEDEELAIAVGRRAAELLSEGNHEWRMPLLASDVQHRRAG